MGLLEVRDLKKTFRAGNQIRRRGQADVRALQGVTFAVEKGEIFGLAGESGSGKSTLANCILGLETPTSGEIIFQADLLNPGRRTTQPGRIQAVFQDPHESLNPRLSVTAIVREPLDILGRETLSARNKRVREMLELVDLPEVLAGEPPHRLSGGQKQRVAIARALIAQPELLVADEPVSALDVSVQQQVLELLGRLRREMSLTILFISHDLAVMSQLCDRAAIMRDGLLVELAPIEEIFQRAQHPYTRSLLKAMIPDAAAAAREWLQTPLPEWQGVPGPLHEISPGHWVARESENRKLKKERGRTPADPKLKSNG